MQLLTFLFVYIILILVCVASEHQFWQRIFFVNVNQALNGVVSKNNTKEEKCSTQVIFDDDPQLPLRLKELNKHQPNIKGPIIPVLVIACNRISVANCLDDLIHYRPNHLKDQFPIIVSQDCNHGPTRDVIKSYKQVIYMRQPNQSDICEGEKRFDGYFKIARHYKWALNTTFNAGFEYVIIVEDDLNIAPDFYEYFLATHELLKNDSTLWCVSAWNDNGKITNIDMTKPELLYRSDFFPGLGWMLKRDLWNELSVKWPKGFWDDWIREPEQRKNRACIRPEIPRSRTFGRIGVSNGEFYDDYLQYITLNENPVNFTQLDLKYLLKGNYDRQFLRFVYSLPAVTVKALLKGRVKLNGPVRIRYSHNQDRFIRLERQFGLMDNFKAGIPRTSYRGIVSTFYKNRRVFLTPKYKWKGYNPTWS